MPESLLATFVKVYLRTDAATDMHARRRGYGTRALRGIRKTPNPSVIDGIYG
jgi:hypothetical protein